MDFLRNLFPFSFREFNTQSFVITIIIYIVLGIVGGIVAWLIGIIPLFGFIIKYILDVAVGLYVLLGIIFACLVYGKVMY